MDRTESLSSRHDVIGSARHDTLPTARAVLCMARRCLDEHNAARGHDAATPATGAPGTCHRPPFQLLTCVIHSARSGEQWTQDTSASARHRHAVDRGEIVDGERVRQLEESYALAIFAHLATSNGKPRPSRLGSGDGASPAQAVVRGGGHEPARSAAKSRPAVTRRHAQPCAVRRAGRVECAVGAQGAEELAMARAEDLVRFPQRKARGECTFPQGIFKGHIFSFHFSSFFYFK